MPACLQCRRKSPTPRTGSPCASPLFTPSTDPPAPFPLTGLLQSSNNLASGQGQLLQGATVGGSNGGLTTQNGRLQTAAAGGVTSGFVGGGSTGGSGQANSLASLTAINGGGTAQGTGLNTGGTSNAGKCSRAAPAGCLCIFFQSRI